MSRGFFIPKSFEITDGMLLMLGRGIVAVVVVLSSQQTNKQKGTDAMYTPEQITETEFTNDYRFILESVSIWVDLVSENPDEFRASIYDKNKELLQEAWGNTISNAVSKAITYIIEEN